MDYRATASLAEIGRSELLRDALPSGSRVMSFRSVASFMLDAVERRSHVAEVVGLGPQAAFSKRTSETTLEPS